MALSAQKPEQVGKEEIGLFGKQAALDQEERLSQ